VQKQTFDVMGT